MITITVIVVVVIVIVVIVIIVFNINITPGQGQLPPAQQRLIFSGKTARGPMLMMIIVITSGIIR